MQPRHWAITLGLITVAAVITSTSQILMRFGGRKSALLNASTSMEWLNGSRYWLIGILVGWFAGLLWAWTIRKVSLSFAFPLFTGLAYILTLSASWLLLKESLQPLQWCGIAAILGGILLILIPGSGG